MQEQQQQRQLCNLCVVWCVFFPFSSGAQQVSLSHGGTSTMLPSPCASLLQVHAQLKGNMFQSLSLLLWPLFPSLCTHAAFQFHLWESGIHVVISSSPYDIFLQPFPLLLLQRLQPGRLLHWTSSPLGL
jgi:hypothetical protein